MPRRPSGWTFNTNRLRGRLKVAAADLDPAYPGSADQKSGLYLFQCGNTVADVNKVLESNEPAALSVHLGRGQRPDHRRRDLLRHPRLGARFRRPPRSYRRDPSDRHRQQPFLDRAQEPSGDEARPGSSSSAPRLKRDDDDLFNAAVVSFGSFGIIGAVVLETVPRYLLETHPGTAKLDEDLWKVIGGLDFSAHPFFKPDGKMPGGKPYFFQAVINPASDEVLLNANYKKDCPADYEPNYDLTQKPGAIGPGFDSLSTVGFILDKFKGVIPKFSKLVAGALFDTAARPARRARFTASRRPSSMSPAAASRSRSPTRGGRWRR